MSGFDRFYVRMAVCLSLWTFIAVMELAALGQPPRHCHYLVPVKAHPGVLRCSEYPGTNK